MLRPRRTPARTARPVPYASDSCQLLAVPDPAERLVLACRLGEVRRVNTGFGLGFEGNTLIRMTEIARLLDHASQGDPKAAEELLPLVYEELRRLAAQRMAHEAPGQTLQPTALVHEAWLKLVGPGPHQWNSLGHFFGAAAEAMRRILIDRARKRKRERHGHGLQRIDLALVDVAITSDDDTLLLVNEALDRLAVESPDKVELIKLRFFAGLSIPEAAAALGISEATAKRHWAFARAWLYDELKRMASN